MEAAVMGTRFEWDCFIAEQRSKTHEQCVEEARARLRARRHDPLDVECQKDFDEEKEGTYR